MRLLWDAACKEVTDASVVVFMGYRFPPTDSYALERLLGALGENKTPNTLHVVTVLGPNNPDEERLAHMARTAFLKKQRQAAVAGTNTANT
jgi:hypothetical protein